MKIFDISMAKTGTSSLASAMRKLGFKSVHNCPSQYMADYISKVPYGNFDLNIIRDHDFIGNLLQIYYPILAEEFPDAKFVMLDRDVDSWISSMHYQFDRVKPKFGLDVTVFNRIVHTGSIDNRKPYWLKHIFDRHKNGVLSFFNDKPDRLLVMKISDGWKTLCQFFNLPVPNTAFPHNNKSAVADNKLLKKKYHL